MSWLRRQLVLLTAVAGLCGALPGVAHGALVAQYHLDDLPGDGSIADSSGSALNGAARVGVAVGDGRFGGALGTRGTGHGFNVANDARLEPAQLTVAAWVRKGAPYNVYRTIVGKGGRGCSDSTYALYTAANGGLAFYVTLAGTNPVQSFATTPPIAPERIWDGAWHAIAGTFDGTTATLWVDGAAVSSVSVSGDAAGPLDYSTYPERRLQIGRYDQAGCSAPGFQFLGDIDEVRLYDRALVAEQIGVLHNPAALTPPVVSDLVSQPPPPTTTPPPAAAPPVASFTAPERVSASAPVTLNAGTTTGATRLRWDFNSDGKVDLAASPQSPVVRLIVAQPQRLDVKLTVVGAGGATSTFSRPISVGPGGTKSPPVGLLSRLPAVMSTGPAESAQSTSVVANLPCLAGTTVAFRLIEARGCFRRTEDLEDVPAGERALGRRHYANAEYSLPSVVASICGQAARGQLPQERCDSARAYFRQPREFYISTQPIKLNGITIRPRNGSSVVVFPVAERVLASDATMTWNAITVKSGELDLNLASQIKVIASSQRAKDFPTGSADLLTFSGRDLPSIAGFRINGAITLRVGSDDGRRYSEGDLSLQLPPAFSLFGGNPPSGRTVLRADNDAEPDLDALRIAVPEAHIGGVRFTDLSFEYRARGGIDGDTNPGTSCARNEWKARGNVFISGGESGEAGFKLTPPPSQNGVGFCAGAFKHAGGALKFGGPIPEPQLFPGVLLNEINFALQLNPFLVRGGATISVARIAQVKGALLLAFPTQQNPYVLNTADAGREFAQLAGRRFTSPTVAVGGDVGINVPEFGTLGFANGAMMYSFPDYVFFGGEVSFGVPGLRITGGVSGELSLATRLFQLGGRGQACLGVNLVCVGANANIGSRGVSACGEVAGLRPGGGYRFADRYLAIWPIDGCKPSRFWISDVRAGARAAQAGTLTFEVARDEGVKQIRLAGQAAAPTVRVQGPSGESLEVAGGDLQYSAGNDLGAVRELEGKRTFLSLADGPGRYTVTLAPGSAPITEVAESRKGYDSDLDARVRGSGRQRTLDYDLGGKGGELEVRLYERGRDVFREIARLKGGKGDLRFTPAEGEGAQREIVALTTVNGVPIPEQILARFTAATPAAMRGPQDVEVARTGTGLSVTWTKVPGATAYGIVVRQADGETQRLEVEPGREQARVRRVDQRFGGTVTVSARDDERDWVKGGRDGYPRAKAPFTVVQTDRDNERRDELQRAKGRDGRAAG